MQNFGVLLGHSLWMLKSSLKGVKFEETLRDMVLMDKEAQG